MHKKITMHPCSLLNRCIACFWLALVLVSCSKRETAPPLADAAAAQHAYFPLVPGKYIVYSVDSIVYDFVPGGIARDSSRTFVREQVGDTLYDNTGQLVYTIERYERQRADAPWALQSVRTASRTAKQAISTENNLRFLKLVFPMDRRSEWNGNLWIDPELEIEVAGERMRLFSNWRYEVDSIDIKANIGAFSFDSVLVVTEADDSNIIEKRFSKARYAKGVGLVQREQWILDSQYCNRVPPPADCATKPWLDKAEKGYVLKQTIIEYN